MNNLYLRALLLFCPNYEATSFVVILEFNQVREASSSRRWG